MSKFDRNRIKDGREKLCTNKQTDKQTDRHYENNGHLAMNQLDLFKADEVSVVIDFLCTT